MQIHLIILHNNNYEEIVFGILMITAFVNSQAQKGNVLVYGTMGINTKKEPDDDKPTIFSFYQGVGYQFSKDRTAGITAGMAMKNLFVWQYKVHFANSTNQH